MTGPGANLPAKATCRCGKPSCPHPAPEPDHARYVKLMQCTKCGQQYPIVPYFKAAAPHGPSKDCRGVEWVPVRVRIERDRYAI